MADDRSCWACRNQKNTSPDTFLGLCTRPAPSNPDRNPGKHPGHVAVALKVEEVFSGAEKVFG